nr:MAG TPA: hypothetical protein [Caudoviricetes sp.]
MYTVQNKRPYLTALLIHIKHVSYMCLNHCFFFI